MADYARLYALNGASGNISNAAPTDPGSFSDPTPGDGGSIADGDVINIGGTNYTVLGVNSDGSLHLSSGGSEYYMTDGTYASGTKITNLAGYSSTGSTTLLCFLTGTLIRTEKGDAAVEQLAIGDLLVTVEGDLVAVKWIGRQTVRRIFAVREMSYPVCIKAGALGESTPSRDLYVSPDHAMLVDGLLVHASALVNCTSIHQVADVPEVFTYYHIETEGHRNILAEGAAAETFVDNVTRRRFDNYAEYEALYPEAGAIVEQTLPRVTARRLLPHAIASKLLRRAEMLGYTTARAA